jgi:hypothetical protein
MELSVVEMPALGNVGGFLSQVIGADGQVVEERAVHYAGEPLAAMLEEPSNSWEKDSVSGDEAAGEARGREGPAQTATLEETMEALLRVASPDIPALFPRDAPDFSLKPVSGVQDLIRAMGGYGANCKTAEEAEAEYRARREEAKVWRRENEEADRQVQEIRARQKQVYCDDMASRVSRTMDNEEEARLAEEKRVKKVREKQLEEEKRNEDARKQEEWEKKRREAAKKKKEEREKKEEEERKRAERRQKKVNEALARAKEEQEKREESRKSKTEAEEAKLFLAREAERDRLLAEEAKEQLTKKSAEADRARMARAEKDWRKLREEESAQGIPQGVPAFNYRSRDADKSRETCESLGNMRDQWGETILEKGHWFDSDLCILEPVNNLQMMAFEQLKTSGLLCSRYSATVQKGRRFFALAGKDMELPNGKGGKKKAASRQQLAVNPAAPAPEGGSPAEGETAEEQLAVPGPSGLCAGSRGSKPPVPVEEPTAAAMPAARDLPAKELVVAEAPLAVPEKGPEERQLEVMIAELPGVELSVPAAQAAAAAPATDSPTVAELVSEALLALELGIGAKAPTGTPAVVEPAAAKAAASAVEPAPARRERPELAGESAAAPGGYWVLNSAVGAKVILRKALSDLAATAAETAAARAEWAGEPVPESGEPPAAGRAACETAGSPLVTASEPGPPRAAAASVKRKAKAGVTGGSQKRKKSSPAEAKDL